MYVYLNNTRKALKLSHWKSNLKFEERKRHSPARTQMSSHSSHSPFKRHVYSISISFRTLF